MDVADYEVWTKVLDLEQEAKKALLHPADFLTHVKCVDAKTGEVFYFDFEAETYRDDLLDAWEVKGQPFIEEEGRGWYWQKQILDDWLEEQLWLGLKGRQLGITWLAGGYALWKAITTPGTTAIIVSVNQDEASKVVNRIWDMWLSLPTHIRMGARVLKPSRGRPFDEIQWQHPDGKISRISGLPATKKAAHGETVSIAILDEEARQDFAAEIWKGVLPTIADGGQIIAISTANGVSNELTGEGNHFHHLYVNHLNYGIKRRFLHWALNPDRTREWHSALALPPKDKAEQYPDLPDEAFILSGDVYFDVEALAWYIQNRKRDPLYRFNFVRKDARNASVVKRPDGVCGVYVPPKPGHSYALAADTATGRGMDFQAAWVIDLATMEFAAEIHCKWNAVEYAYQLHYLGRMYNTAIIAVEMGGGYGEPVVVNLRDGKDGRPPYPKLYRFRAHDRADLPERYDFGYPITMKTRPLVLSSMEEAIRSRVLPWLPAPLIPEAQTFVRASTNPSPRAQDGCNDDRVMAAAIVLELYREFGKHPDKPKKRRRNAKNPYPWLPPRGENDDARNGSRGDPAATRRRARKRRARARRSRSPA